MGNYRIYKDYGQEIKRVKITSSLIVDGIVQINLGSDATGDLFYRGLNGNITRLGIGATGQVLTVDVSGLPVWANNIGGGSGGGTNPSTAAIEVRFKVGDANAPIAGASSFTLTDCSGNVVLGKKVDYFRERDLQYEGDDFTYNQSTGVITLGLPLIDGERNVFKVYPTSAWIECAFGDTAGGNGGPATNIPPTASAGSDQNILLPQNSVTLTGFGTDPDGGISSYLWTKLSGNSDAIIANPGLATTTVSNLSEGTYVFRLTVTDNLGATGTDDVVITVRPEVIQGPTNGLMINGTDQLLSNGIDGFTI